MSAALLIGLVLAFVVLGPKRMHSMLGLASLAKVRFDKASQEIRAQLAAQLEDPDRDP